MGTGDLKAYELIQQKELKDMKTTGYLLRHTKTGARVVLMDNSDENKVFYIGFRTPPGDSTGLPHIMEHSVLCGSRHFPLKDPFIELAKGSLNTFLNAMTYPDKTVYPVASCNDQDFRNLMHVYMDAVFYPNIYKREEIFRQEGWSYNLKSAEEELTYNGVVYNEMKGVFSSPDGVLERMTLRSLFPDTCYANESGGDPECIPELSYERFLDFHGKYYHPSNSYIYLYGKMDFAERLAWLDREYLSAFDKEDIDSRIGLQEPFMKVRDVSETYSITNDEPEEDNSYLSYSKVIDTSLNPELYRAFEVLDYALLSAPGAPLTKALLDAGIGKDIMGSYENGSLQPFFSIIAKGANASQKDEFVRVIEDTLRSLAANGINKKSLEAGIQSQEFLYREADFGNYPKGLAYGLQILDSWLYDDEKPFIHMDATCMYSFLREQVHTGYFEKLTEKYLLNNTHGAVLVIRPEKGREAGLERELKGKLAAYKQSLSMDEINALVNGTKALDAYHDSKDDPEDIKKIPLLARRDITRDVMPLQNEELKVADIPVLYHNIDTNGIGYVTILFDLEGIAEEELAYAGILQGVIGLIDTKSHDYGELTSEINLHTGGIATSIETYPDVEKPGDKGFKATFEIRSKALYGDLAYAFSLMREMLVDSKLDDGKRLKEIISMTKSRLQARFQSAGHVVAASRALSYASPVYRFKDLTEGIGYYEVIKRIEESFGDEKESLIAKLQSLAKRIFTRNRMMASYTAEEEGVSGMKEQIPAFAAGLFPAETDKTRRKTWDIRCKKRNEGFKTASKVQYVSRAGNYRDAGYEYKGTLRVLRVILGYEYLWKNIREKGGAYGCMSSFGRTGDSYFASYRDPHLRNTNDIYEGVPEYLKNFKADERDMDKYVIGTISSLDQPLTPSAKGDRALACYMTRVTEEMLQKERDEILNASDKDIRDLSGLTEAVLSRGQICVIGGEEKIEEAKDMFMEVRGLL